MRPIIFRAKRKDNGEWVEGDFVSNKYILQGYRVERGFVVPYNAFEVVPETVGQYTGLKDKNGKKIFEGDIIKAITVDTNAEQIAVVKFGHFHDDNGDEDFIGFYIEFNGVTVTICQLLLEEVKERFEVIGNIHDNPELLEEQGND